MIGAAQESSPSLGGGVTQCDIISQCGPANAGKCKYTLQFFLLSCSKDSRLVLVISHSFKMLVLYETAMGYCLFKLSDSAKLESADLYKSFETPEKATKLYVQDACVLETTQPGLMDKVEA